MRAKVSLLALLQEARTDNHLNSWIGMWFNGGMAKHRLRPGNRHKEDRIMHIHAFRMELLFILVAVLGLTAVGCVWEQPVPRGGTRVYVPVPRGGETVIIDKQHPGVVREYYYYPSADIYYDPASTNWYWYEKNSWHRGQDLPRHLRVREGERVIIRTDADYPYQVHERTRIIERRTVPAY
jgi:hypothetical protein